MTDVFLLLLTLVGVVCVAAGVWWVYPPAGLASVGVLCLGAAFRIGKAAS